MEEATTTYSYRSERRDSAFRRVASWAINRLRERLTDIRTADHGCMLRVPPQRGRHHQPVARAEHLRPALAYLYAPSHRDRGATRSARRAPRNTRLRADPLNFDLITGFSVRPLRFFSLLGMLVALGSVFLYVGVLLYRFFAFGLGNALQNAWDRDVLEFFLIGMALFGLGIIGEYIVRINEQVKGRPRYLVAAVLEKRA
jgi:undecaprenyl-phosphate 4-deoxy-4-formamido-L-arabinose transferase